MSQIGTGRSTRPLGASYGVAGAKDEGLRAVELDGEDRSLGGQEAPVLLGEVKQDRARFHETDPRTAIGLSADRGRSSGGFTPAFARIFAD